MVAQIVVPVCQICAELGEGSWQWWLRGCWQWTCEPIGGGVVAASLAIAAYVGVQLWAAHKQPKA